MNSAIEEETSLALDGSSQHLPETQLPNKPSIEDAVLPTLKHKSPKLVKILSQQSPTAAGGILRLPNNQSPTQKDKLASPQRNTRQRSKTSRAPPMNNPAVNLPSPTERNGSSDRKRLSLRFHEIPGPQGKSADQSGGLIFGKKISGNGDNYGSVEGKERPKETRLLTEDESKTNLENIINILNKNPNERNEVDLEKLASLVTDITFFQNLEATRGKQNLLRCLSRLTYLHVPMKKPVFKQGEIGTAYYVILKGKVNVNRATWVKAEKEEFPGEKEKNEGRTSQRSIGHGNHYPLPHNLIRVDELEASPRSIPDNSPRRVAIESQHKVIQTLVNSDVCQLGEGQSFGEIALLRKKPRGTTVTAVEDCHFAVLEKHDFELILSEYEEKLLSDKLSFLDSMKIFSGWNYNLICQLHYHLQVIKYKRNNAVYKEGSKATHVYIVKKGELTIFRNIKVSEADKTHKMQRRSRKGTFKNVAIATLGPREMLGEEDMLTSGYYTSSVMCTSAEAELLCISRKDFTNHIWDEEDAKFFLKSSIKIKLQNYKDRTQEIQAKWNDNIALLSNLNQSSNSNKTSRKSPTNADVYQRLEQYYQVAPADNMRSSVQFSPENPSEIESISHNESPVIRPLQIDTQNVLAFLDDRTDFQSPQQIKLASPLKESPSMPRLQGVVPQRQSPVFTFKVEDMSKDSRSPGKATQEPDLNNRRKLLKLSSVDLGPGKDVVYIQENWPECSPIKSSNRSLILSERESPDTFLRGRKETLPDDDKFSLEGRSRNASISNTRRGNESVVGNPIKIYKNMPTTQILSGRDNLPSISRSPERIRETMPNVSFNDSSRVSVIPRIRAEARNALNLGTSRSQIFEPKLIQLLGSNPISPQRRGLENSPVKLRPFETSRIAKEESEVIEEERKSVHPKIQMLGSLKTQLRVGVMKYQSLQKHLVGPNEMERENITKVEIMKQIDENKQSMKLVFGTKLFTERKREEMRKYYENRRIKDRMTQPNLMNEAVLNYLKGVMSELGIPEKKPDEVIPPKVEAEVNLESYKKEYQSVGNKDAETNRSASEQPGLKRKIPKLHHQSMIIKQQQQSFNKEVEGEMQKAYKRIYGKLVTKKLKEKDLL